MHGAWCVVLSANHGSLRSPRYLTVLLPTWHLGAWYCSLHVLYCTALKPLLAQSWTGRGSPATLIHDFFNSRHQNQHKPRTFRRRAIASAGKAGRDFQRSSVLP